MNTQTIQSLAITMSEAGYGNYVIIDLEKARPEETGPGDLPHGTDELVGKEKTAIEFPVDENDDDAHARTAYREIVEACRTHDGILRGSVTLIEDGEVETATIG
tara:strand:- start:8028 stop:8339 length:312 start_codon:yes stop_codon:yes gene_type:complete